MTSVTQINKTTIRFGDTDLDFQHRISKWLEIDDLVVIHFGVRDYAFGDSLVGQNVIALNRSGEFVWRIENSGLTTRSMTDRKTIVPQAVMQIGYLKRTGELWARYQWMTASVELRSGKILDWEEDVR